jgi:hypothetical protein
MSTPDTQTIFAGSEPALRTSILKRAFSFPAMLTVVMWGAVFVPLRKFVVDPDVWWHIKVGATLLATHRFPTSDPYSFTAHGSPWIAYEWLGEVLLALAHRAGGLRGLLGLDFALAAAIVLALYALATLHSRNCKAAFAACAMLLPLAYLSFSLRPQMLGYFFLVLTLIVLERFRGGHTGSLWLLVPIFWLWVNLHGSFVIGLFAVGVYGLSGLVKIHWGELESRLWTHRERVRLELVVLLILVALTLTPYGTETCLYPLDMAFSQPINVANIQEWQPMMFGEFFGKLFLVIFIGFLLAQIGLRIPWRLEQLVLFTAGLAAACIHVRFVLIFVPFCAPLLAGVLAHWAPSYEPDKDKYALNAIIMACVIGAVIWFFPTRAYLAGQLAEKWPVKAVEYLKQHPAPQPMFNTYGYGGYLIWQLDSQNKVFIDGRGDIYERLGVFSDYIAISRLDVGTPTLLGAYGIQSCLVNRDEALATWLAASPVWQKVYSDKVSALFVRKNLDASKAAP